MFNPHRSMFIHGLEGSSQGVKASLLHGLFPEMLIPDFPGSLNERQAKLEVLLGSLDRWTLIGSSLGGLMAAQFACRHPGQVRKLVLLAPALIWPEFAGNLPAPVNIPVLIYHGSQDELIPLSQVRLIAERIFTDLQFIVVDDNHGLYDTVHRIDWTAALL